MPDPLEGIEQQVRKRNFDTPPLHLWNPPLSGDIDIRIAAGGSWFHDGELIRRDALVRLFASILRRESDGEYYLVTPAEKWRIKVELHPLMVTDVGTSPTADRLQATLNTGKTVLIDAQHSLSLEPTLGDIAVLALDHGLSALFTRAAWYRLVDMADDQDGRPCINSGAYCFPLSASQSLTYSGS